MGRNLLINGVIDIPRYSKLFRSQWEEDSWRLDSLLVTIDFSSYSSRSSVPFVTQTFCICIRNL